MEPRKRISIILAIVLVPSMLVLIASTLGRGTDSSTGVTRVKVLRRKDQLKVKPTAEEIASFRRQVAQEERGLEDKIPKHVPIRIKIKVEKEKAFKDLTNARWLRDFELEVTNTSNKPIYFLEIWADFPEIISANGHKVGFSLRHGRIDFIHFSTLRIPTDIPIRPGETYSFTIAENYQRGWETHKVAQNWPDPKKVRITFTQLSYGDGSGFNGSDAKPYPYKRDKSS